MVLKTTSRRFTWLHFTDLHVGVEGSAYIWPNVEEIVLNDLGKMHEKTGPWDAIFFSGDLTQAGGEIEFQEFNELLGRVREHIKSLGSDPIFLAVPGNHDLVRPVPAQEMVVDLLWNSWLTSPELRNTFWKSDDCQARSVVDKAFSNWSRWAESAIDRSHFASFRPGLLPGDFAATIERNDLKIGVLGLNTAALQLKGGDYEKRLSLHARQLEPLFPDKITQWVKGHDACFLMTHHPANWLDKDGERALKSEIWPPGRFVLHLCGHLHQPDDLTQSIGGAHSKTTLIGRSLFGMEHWEGEVERFHGYSVGSIEFGDNRKLRVWPRAGYKQLGGNWRIDKDVLVETESDEGMSPRDLGVSPRAKLAQQMAYRPKLTGWIEITESYLADKKSELSSEELELFFNGQEPSWKHALLRADQLPRRKVVKEVVEAIQNRQTSTLIRLIVPGGEGKSMALKHIAVELAQSGKKVFFRDEEGSVIVEEVLRLPDNEPYFLLSDDADRIGNDVFNAVKLLHDNGKENVFWVLAARDTDWHACFPGGHEPAWSRLIIEWPETKRRSTFFLMDKSEAQEIVLAWERAGSLGQKLQNIPASGRADFLWSAATEAGKRLGATFFGAILDVRFTEEGLRDHVSTLMSRLREKRIQASKYGRTLYDAFLYAAAADVTGAPGIDLHVLADLIGVERRERRPKILWPLGFEAAATGSREAIRIRHLSIAKVALIVANDEGEDLGEIYKEIVQGTAITNNTGIRVSPYAEIMNCPPILLTELPTLGFTFDEAERIAKFVADEAEKAEPELLVRTNNRAKTYREAGHKRAVMKGETGHEKHEAAQVMRSSIAHLFAKRDLKMMIRSYLNEFSVSEGDLNPIHGLLLAGLSIADIRIDDRINTVRADRSLASIGGACVKIDFLNRESPYAKAIRAVAVLGGAIARSDKSQKYFQRYGHEADKLKVGNCDFSTAFNWLEGAVRNALEQTEDSEILKLVDFLGISAPNQVSFKALKAIFGMNQ